MHGDAARACARRRLRVCTGLNAHANLVLRPHARATGGHPGGAAHPHSGRPGHHQRRDGLLGGRFHLQVTLRGDAGVDDQGAGGRNGRVTHGAKAFLTNQVTGHGHANRGTHTGCATACRNRRRQGCNARRNRGVAVRLDHHIALGHHFGLAQHGIGRAHDRVDGDCACTGHGHRVAATKTDGGRSGHRGGVDGVACDAELAVIGFGQGVGPARAVVDHPALTGFDHGNVEHRLDHFPVFGVQVIGLGQVQLQLVLAQVAVHHAGDAPGLVLVGYLHRVALEHLGLVSRHTLPAVRLGEVLFGQVQFALGGADVAVHMACQCATDHTHLVVLFDVLGRGLAAQVIPFQTLGALEIGSRAQGLDAGQLQAQIQQGVADQGPTGLIGEFGGQLPAGGVGKVFFPEADFFFSLVLFPQVGVLEVGIAQIHQLPIARADVFVNLAQHAAVFEVAVHTDALVLRDQNLAIGCPVIHGSANEAVHLAHLAACGVQRIHPHGVARTQGAGACRDILPVPTVDIVLLGQVQRRAKVTQILIGLAGRETNSIVRVQFGEPFGAQVVPWVLTPCAGVAGFCARIGGAVEQVGCNALGLQGAPLAAEQLHAARAGVHRDFAVARLQVHQTHIGQHIALDAVEGQRQTDGDRNGRAARQGGGQRCRAGHGVDGALVAGRHADAVGLHLAGGAGATDQGFQPGVDAVFRIHPRRTGRDGVATRSAHGRRAGAHIRLNERAARGIDL